MNISSSVPEKLLLGHSFSWGSRRFSSTGWAKKVIPLVQCNICTRGITFWPTLYVCTDLGSYCLWQSADDQCPTVPTGLNPALGTAIFGAHVGGDAIGISVRCLTIAENFEFCAIVPLCFRDPLFIYLLTNAIYACYLLTLWQMDGRTDRQTDRQTDTTTGYTAIAWCRAVTA